MYGDVRMLCENVGLMNPVGIVDLAHVQDRRSTIALPRRTSARPRVEPGGRSLNRLLHNALDDRRICLQLSWWTIRRSVAILLRFAVSVNRHARTSYTRPCAILPAWFVALPLDNVGASLIYRIGSTATYKKLFRYWYPLMTKRLNHGDDVQFLNWGYEEDPPLGLPLDPADEPNRYSIQLYHQTATQDGVEPRPARRCWSAAPAMAVAPLTCPAR